MSNRTADMTREQLEAEVARLRAQRKEALLLAAQWRRTAKDFHRVAAEWKGKADEATRQVRAREQWLKESEEAAIRVIFEYRDDLEELTRLLEAAHKQVSGGARWLRERQVLVYKAVRRKALADFMQDNPTNRLKWAREFCKAYSTGNNGGLPKPLTPKAVTEWIREVHGAKKKAMN